jgi:hypothetical protein
VAKDANGNVSQNFLNTMLTPKSSVNTNLFDSSSASGLSKFALVGIRMLGHDLYDGEINGDVALRTLFNPTGSNNAPFNATPATTDMVRAWGQKDLQDDGTINGSAYVKLIEDVWPTTDGVPIPGFANGLQKTNANLNVDELFRNTTNVETPQGLQQFVQNSGVSVTELLNFSLWGHRIMDKSFTTQNIAQEALSNPTSIDFGLTNATPEGKAFAQSLVNNPNAKSTVGLGVLNFLTTQLNTRQ